MGFIVNWTAFEDFNFIDFLNKVIKIFKSSPEKRLLDNEDYEKISKFFK